VAVAGASGRYLDAYRAIGLRALPVGEEALVAPRAFSLEGRAVRKVRQSVTRAARRGWSLSVERAGEMSAADWRDVGRLEDEWRASQRRLHGFAMTLGRLGGAAEDERIVYVRARGPDGQVGALLRFVPYRGGLSLDAMRRAADAPNGITEALVARALEHARESGVREVSLNFAGFGHIMAEGRKLSGRQKLARIALTLVHGRFQLERLSGFNEKFGPAWRPRYLVYGGRSELPRSALRVLQAEAYIRPPRERPLEARWRAPAWTAGAARAVVER
jgi:lysyl-tRNA synthetase, class II